MGSAISFSSLASGGVYGVYRGASCVEGGWGEGAGGSSNGFRYVRMDLMHAYACSLPPFIKAHPSIKTPQPKSRIFPIHI